MLSAKGRGAKVTDFIDGDVEFKALLYTLSSLCGKRAKKHIRCRLLKYMYDQRAKVKQTVR